MTRQEVFQGICFLESNKRESPLGLGRLKTNKVMKKIAIYKYKSDIEEYAGKISRVQVLPDKSEEELNSGIEKYNSVPGNNYIVSCEPVSDEICKAIQFLIKDRAQDKNKILETLHELQNDVNDLGRSIDDTCDFLERELKKEKEK